MPILNIFAFGTAEKSTDRQKNLIHYFAEHCEGPKHIIEGPNLLGTDVDDHAHDTFNYIKRVIKGNNLQEPLTVNMLGYSRGATTLLAIANLFYEHPQWRDRVQFNIMAIDPVAGPGWKGEERFRRIPPNITNYVSCLQLHESRSFFKSQSLKRMVVEDREKTRAFFLPFPGNHPSPVRASATKELNHTAQAVHYVAYDFLHRLKTKFKDNKMPPLAFKNKHQYLGVPHEQSEYGTKKSEQALLELFSEMKLADTEYQVMKGKNIVKTFPSSLEEYTLHSHYFINEFHSYVFQKNYPRTYDHLFQMGSKAQKTTEEKEEKSAREQEFAQLVTHNPKLADTLRSLWGELRETNKMQLPEQPLGSNPNTLSRLEKNLIQEMRFYQRERGILGRRNARHDEANTIIEFILQTNRAQGTKDEKIAAIQAHLSSCLGTQDRSFTFHLQRMVAHCQYALDSKTPVPPLPRKSLPVMNQKPSRPLLWLAVGAAIFCSLYFTGGLAAIPYLGWLVTQIGSAANPLFSALFGLIAKKVVEFVTWLVKCCWPAKEKVEKGSVEEKAGLLADDQKKQISDSSASAQAAPGIDLDALSHPQEMKSDTTDALVHDTLAAHPPAPFVAPATTLTAVSESTTNTETHDAGIGSAPAPADQRNVAEEVTRTGETRFVCSYT